MDASIFLPTTMRIDARLKHLRTTLRAPADDFSGHGERAVFGDEATRTSTASKVYDTSVSSVEELASIGGAFRAPPSHGMRCESWQKSLALAVVSWICHLPCPRRS